MVKGYKTVNIKEEVISRIRDLEENKKEIEEDRFNLAGFVANVLLSYEEREKELAYYKREFANSVGDATKIGFEEGRKEGEKGSKELSDKDIKRVAAEMLLEIGMHIENGIAKGIKDLR